MEYLMKHNLFPHIWPGWAQSLHPSLPRDCKKDSGHLLFWPSLKANSQFDPVFATLLIWPCFCIPNSQFDPHLQKKMGQISKVENTRSNWLLDFKTGSQKQLSQKILVSSLLSLELKRKCIIWKRFNIHGQHYSYFLIY